MKLQVVSDLHLEFTPIGIPNAGDTDVLILSGDICVAEDLHSHPVGSANPLVPLGRRQLASETYQEFFAHISSEYKNVIYVLGNHEHYHGKIDTSHDVIRKTLSDMNITNIHLLENESIVLDGIVFVGGTLWTDMNNGNPMSMNAVQSGMNDFRIIRVAKRAYRKFNTMDAVALHTATKNFIETQAGVHSDLPVVVCTHHAPSYQSVAEQFKGSELNAGYASDLSDLILDNPNIKLWTHGHMHNSSDYMIGDTRIIANPRGYYNENPEFNRLKVFEV